MNTGSILRAWVEVDTEAIAHNLAVARKAAENVALMPVVKANAYGHGLELVARRLDRENIAFFGVANVTEARQLADIGVNTRPFILGPTLPEEREEIVQRSWGCTISSAEEIFHFESLCAANPDSKCSLHLAVDTGMGREGFLPAQIPELVALLQQLRYMHLEGIMSHYSAADEDPMFTQQQMKSFTRCSVEMRRRFPLMFSHIAASAGQMSYPVPPSNLARPGLILYGVSPLKENPHNASLRPALRLLSRVVLVRTLPAEHAVSYGHTYTTKGPTRVATIGIGYADGLPRSIATRASYVCIAGQRCPILGRITMDLIMVDVTALPDVREGDVVELIGPHLPVSRMAKWAGTIPWEIFTGLGVRLPRLEKDPATPSVPPV